MTDADDFAKKMAQRKCPHPDSSLKDRAVA
jgi:hypothetical protein